MMTETEKQNFITATRDRISDLVRAYRELEMLGDNAAAQGGLATIFSDADFSGEHAGIAAATMVNFYTGNLPTIEQGLFSGSAGGNKTNTYGLAKIAIMQG